MKQIQSVVVVLMLLVALPVCGFAQEIATSKEKAINELLEVTGAKQVGIQMGMAINQSLAASLKAQNPNIPPRALEILGEETQTMMTENVDALFASIVPVYAEFFTEKEIRDMLAFYETPTGKKTIATMPQILNKSMMIGQQWGQSLVPQLVTNLERRFKEEGIKVD